MSDPGTKNPQNTEPITRQPIFSLSSLALKSVLLYDWWLVKVADGNGIAVAGLASREREGSRLFHSAAIIKSHDTTILEAKDGIIITVTGFINHSQTIENGFSPHVCSRFRLGFPYRWEEYATKDCSEGSGDGAVPMGESRFGEPGMSSAGNADTSLHVSWVDLPVQHIQDLLLCGTLGDSKDFVDDIIGQFFSPPPRHTPAADHSDLKNKTPSRTTRPAVDKTPIGQKKGRSRGVDETFDFSGTVIEECVNPKRGVVTRRMVASSMSACLDVENRPSVTIVNPVLADETPRKSKKAWDGKKPRDTGETLDVTGVVEECIDPHRGVSTRSLAGIKFTHPPRDGFHSGMEKRNLVKTAYPPRKNKKARDGKKSRDMGETPDVAGLVEESVDQHRGVAMRRADGNPKSVDPPKDAFHAVIDSRTSVTTANPVQVEETPRMNIDPHRGVSTRSMAGIKSTHPPRDAFHSGMEKRNLLKTAYPPRKNKKARDGKKSRDMGETANVAGLVEESVDQHRGVAMRRADGDAVKTLQLSRGVITRSMFRLAAKKDLSGNSIDLSGVVGMEMDYQTADSEHLTDEVSFSGVAHTPNVYSQDDLPKSNVRSMDFHQQQQTILLVGTNVGDISLWGVGSWERLAHKPFKVWDMSAASMRLQTALLNDAAISVNRCVWGPDGLMLGVAFSKHMVQIYTYNPTGELGQYLEIDAHVGGVNDIAFAHPNKKLCIVTCGDDKMIKVWDAVAGRRQYTLEGHEASVYSVCPHYKENIQFILSTALGGKIKVWLYDYLGCGVDYDAPGLWCTKMAYSADGSRLFSCGTSKDGESHLVEWNDSDGSVKRTYLGFKLSSRVVQFDTTRSRFLAVGDEFQIKFWDMDNTSMLTYTEADGGLPAGPGLRFNKEGSLLAVTTSDNGINILGNGDGLRLISMLESKL